MASEFQRLLRERGFVLDPELMEPLLDDFPLYPAWTIVKNSLDGVAAVSSKRQRSIALRSLRVQVRRAELSEEHGEVA